MSYKSDLQIIKQYAKELLEVHRHTTDKIMVACEFINILDGLCKDGIISDKTYSNCYLELDTYYPYIVCGSYRIRV